MRKRALRVKQLALWVLGLQAVDGRVAVACEQRFALVQMKLGMLGYAPIPFHPRKWMLFFGLVDSIPTRRRLRRPQCLITASIRRSI